jgi:SutA RNAP-binding domain
MEMDIDLGFMGSREESAEHRTIASRKRLHDKVDIDVEAFLADGGEIQYVQPHVTADPIERPRNQYGQRPI